MENEEIKSLRPLILVAEDDDSNVLGVVFIIIGINYYGEDLECGSYGVFDFDEKKYVGGDAYNYIISASRSSAVMIKSLIWFVLGSCSIIIGRTFSK